MTIHHTEYHHFHVNFHRAKLELTRVRFGDRVLSLGTYDTEICVATIHLVYSLVQMEAETMFRGVNGETYRSLSESYESSMPKLVMRASGMAYQFDHVPEGYVAKILALFKELTIYLSFSDNMLPYVREFIKECVPASLQSALLNHDSPTGPIKGIKRVPYSPFSHERIWKELMPRLVDNLRQEDYNSDTGKWWMNTSTKLLN
jgi:hypothetical protein